MRLNVPAPSPGVLVGLEGGPGVMGWGTDGVVRLNGPAPSPGVLRGVLEWWGLGTDGVVRLNVPTAHLGSWGGGPGVMGVGDGWSREA